MQWLTTQDDDPRAKLILYGRRKLVEFDVPAFALRVDLVAPRERRPPRYICRYATIPTQYRVRIDGNRWRRVYKMDPAYPVPPSLSGRGVFYIVVGGRRALVNIDRANRYVIENVGRFE